MKSLNAITRILLPITLAAGLSGAALRAAAPAALVDVDKFFPQELDGGRVTVELKGPLLSLAGHIAASHEPEFADLISGIRQVRINVVDMARNPAAGLTEKIRDGRKGLEDSGWARVVSVQDKGDDVAIHVKTGEDDSIEGLCVTVLDGGKEAVFVNIVGSIRPENLSKLGRKLEIPGLKKAGQAVESGKSTGK